MLTVWVLIASRVEPRQWAVGALGAVAVLLAVWGMTWGWWGRPMRQMRELVRRIRAGDAPIEQLADVRRGVRRFVPDLQDLLRELRQQRCDIAKLHDEMRQRIAQRTDALERTIGTLRHQATRDSLTGLFNRRFLDQYLPQVVRRYGEHGLDVTVVMADLDHFKLLNDTLGHAAGDDLLKSVGQIIRSTARGEDAAFRFGGDEFVIVMPNSHADHGRALGERLASLVDALGRTLKLAKQPRLTFGVACLTDVPDRSVAGLMSLADSALYARKRAQQPAKAHAATARVAPLQA
jgi:diguanylate cyclase (GGDEF)-like protein